MPDTPNRQIPNEFLDILYTLPDHDQRIGQFLFNVFAEMQEKGIDPFYAENDEFVAAMKEFADRFFS